MRSDVYWIDWPAPGRLAIMARPRAGDWLGDEIIGWRDAGIGAVVCLLEAAEIDELGLGDEAGLCRSHGIEYIGFPIKDRGLPRSAVEAGKLARQIASKVAEGASVAIHCRAGIGRSSVIAACALIYLGCAPQSAFGLIANARGVPVPDTDEQREWVTEHARAVTSGRLTG